MVFPNGYLILVIVSLLFCSIGFHRFVWFMSVGYGVSTAGIGLAMLVLSIIRGQFDILFAIQCVIFVIYGIRLGGFLLVRELKNEKYRAKMAEVGGDISVPIFVMIPMWLYCGFSYCVQSSGPIYRLLNGATADKQVTLIIGIIISAIGIYLEAMADKQKSAEKLTNPNMPAMNGLYKLCRCPNYFGEILFWTGNFVSGLGVVYGGQIAMAIIGYVLIVSIMLSGAKRVETRHIKHYGDKPEYNAYADKTPLIIPFVPIYHVTSKEKIAAEEAKKAAKKAARAAKKK